jgi:hypothetical protein
MAGLGDFAKDLLLLGRVLTDHSEAMEKAAQLVEDEDAVADDDNK